MGKNVAGYLISLVLIFCVITLTPGGAVGAVFNLGRSDNANYGGAATPGKDSLPEFSPLSAGVHVSNEYLQLYVYPDGNFRGSTASGDHIFYPSDTSDLTIKIGTSEYRIRRGTLSSYRTRDTYINPANDKEAITEWDLPQGIRVSQHIRLEGQHAAFRLKLQNDETSHRDVSIRYLWDTQLCDNDGSPLKAKGTLYTTEMCFEPVDFDYWSAYSRPEESEADLVTYGWWSDAPSRVMFAHWPRAIGTAYSYVWDPSRRFYTPGYVQTPESDSCVLTYWENIGIPANGERSVTAYYGVAVRSGLSLEVGLYKSYYNPTEMMKIYVIAVDADGNSNYPLTRDNTEVRIDGNPVDIEDIASLYMMDDSFLRGWWGYELSVRAPSEPGDYTAWVQVVTDQGVASSSRSFGVVEPFTFVHMTDVHIGPKHGASFLPGSDYPTEQEKDARFSAAIDAMNQGIRIGVSPPLEKPQFVLITGDITERGYQPEAYGKFLQHLQSLDDSIKVYTVPGNHDVYGDRVTYYGLWFLDPDRYPWPFWPFYSRATYRAYLGSPDFSFPYRGVLFIGLDSGHDRGPSFASLGGSGLSNEQMEDLNSFPSSQRKIVFMHHTVFDTAPWNAMITKNREGFREYCRVNNVHLVLSGHTHKDRIFDSAGKLVNANSIVRPLFIETPGITDTLRGYRVIRADSDGVWVYPFTPTLGVQYLRAAANSPVLLHAHDSQGRHTGINAATGERELGIPRSSYLSGFNYEDYDEAGEVITQTAPETIFLYDVTQDYEFRVVANLTGEEALLAETHTFDLIVERQSDDSRTVISHTGVSLFQNTIATLPFQHTIAGLPFGLSTTDFGLHVDYDGDGIVDEIRTPDSVETNYAPTATIVLPVDSSAFSEGEEIVFTGIGVDPEDGVLPEESLFWTSDMDGVIGVGSEFVSNNLTAGMHHITFGVTDSWGQTGTSTVSIVVESTQPGMFIDILTSEEAPGDEQHVTVVETLVDEPCTLSIHIRNTGAGTLQNVQVLTNVGVTEDVGHVDEGETEQVSIEFTPAVPGLTTLNVTVVSDEVEESLARVLLVRKFDFRVSIPRTEYDLGEQIPLSFSVTNEVPDMRFIDAKITIHISNSGPDRTFEIPLLSLAPLEARSTSLTWDTTGIESGIYVISSTLMVAELEVMRDEKTVLLGAATSEVRGVTREANCDILPAVNISLRRSGTLIDTTISDSGGNYGVVVPEFGEYTVVASSEGFRSESQTISVTETTTYNVDFVANYGLIPYAPSTSYVLKCINLWQFGSLPCSLSVPKVLAVINAWQFPA